jgi:ATP-dependent Clp protease protease subunit
MFLSKIMMTLATFGLSISAYAAPAPSQVAVPTPVTSTPDMVVSNATLVCTKGANDKLLCKPLESDEVEFTTKNLIVLRGPIMAPSASSFVKQFHELEHRDEINKIYVYVMSPGGSIFAGDYIYNVIKSSKKEVVMVIDFAASMAFHISEAGTKRLILPTGTLMQHHASGGVGPAPFPNLENQWSWIKRKVNMMNHQDAAGCSKTSYDDFMKNIDHDWWLLSDEALKAGCVDGIATRVSCSKDLISQNVNEEVNLGFATINVVWSGCPLEIYPRSVKMQSNGGAFERLTEKQRQMAEQYIQLITDPLQYYNTYGSFNIGIEQLEDAKKAPQSTK